MDINQTYLNFLQGSLKKLNLPQQIVKLSFMFLKIPFLVMNKSIFKFQKKKMCTKVMHTKFSILVAYKKNHT
jgi:hypothetical protein